MSVHVLQGSRRRPEDPWCNRLFAVGETVGITIGIVRVRAVCQFLAVGYTIAVAVGFDVGWFQRLVRARR